MKYRVTIHPSAKADLRRNATWWAEHHSSQQAIAWLLAIEKQLQELTSLPESHALSPENDAFPFEIRDFLVGTGSRPSYRAVFTIKGDGVHVLTIRRAQEDTLKPSDIHAI